MLDEIFENYKPILIERFKGNVERTFKKIVESLGPELKNVYNDWTWAKVFSNVVKPCYNSATKSINEEKLMILANKYADETVEDWKHKINLKLGELDSGEVVHLKGSDFYIKGTKMNHEVTIFQQMIINVSVRGTLFNQFPSYIHVDKKRISAKKFKEMFKKD